MNSPNISIELLKNEISRLQKIAMSASANFDEPECTKAMQQQNKLVTKVLRQISEFY